MKSPMGLARPRFELAPLQTEELFYTLRVFDVAINVLNFQVDLAHLVATRDQELRTLSAEVKLA